MMVKWVRVAAVVVTAAAGSILVGCSDGDPATVDAQVADARVSRAAPPGATRGLQIAMVNGTCVASWRPPTDDGGSPVTGYVVTIESRAETVVGSGPDIGTAAVARRTRGSPASIVPMALPQTIRVQAPNAAGEGPVGEPAIC
jgi:hypothetical protein